ncbi:MAG TPA: hypothetical protein VEY91_05775 [Candidatus Limnocylindria bacterium]|nr:hypothetical protein [Candidatus Limnocylindria bacterium]
MTEPAHSQPPRPPAPASSGAPPLEPLIDVVHRLEERGLVCALGGSGLLAALGLETSVHDWDLTTDAPVDDVLAALDGLPFQRFGPDDLHADQKLAHSPVEVIVGFAFFAEGGIVRIPTLVRGRWRGVPLGSPECWAVAYALLGRTEKSERLFRHVSLRPDPEALAQLRMQPLPQAVAERIAELG